MKEIKTPNIATVILRIINEFPTKEEKLKFIDLINKKHGGPEFGNAAEDLDKELRAAEDLNKDQ